MKLVRFRDGKTGDPRLGVFLGEEIIDVQPLWEARLLQRTAPLDEMLATAQELRTRPLSDFPEWRRHPQAEVELLAPVQPTSFRDFYAFEAHVRSARKRRGLEMVPEWYDAPAFYFSNTA